MKCEICEQDVNIKDWLKSPSGRKLCVECRGIYTEEEEKMEEQMFKNIAERLEKRKK